MQGRIHSLESFGTVDGPGVRYVVFVQGCPMRCAYCHNPDTWEMNAGTLMEPEEILENYERNKPFYNGGGITVTGGEPLMQIDFLLELFTMAHERGIHTCLDTSGIAYRPNGNPAWLAKLDSLCAVTNLVMLDIKHIDPQKHQELVLQPMMAFSRLQNILTVKMLKFGFVMLLFLVLRTIPQTFTNWDTLLADLKISKRSMYFPIILWERKI